MTEYEFSQLKIGDKVTDCHFNLIGKVTSFDGDLVSIDFIKPYGIKFFDFCGDIYYLNPKTSIGSAKLDYTHIEFIEDELWQIGYLQVMLLKAREKLKSLLEKAVRYIDKQLPKPKK